MDKLKTLSFCVLAAGVTFSNAFTEIATASIIILWLAEKIFKKDFKITGGILVFIFALFVLWSALSFLNTQYLKESLRGLIKIIKYGLLFFATVDYFTSKKKILNILIFTVGIAFVTALNGIIQYITGVDSIRHKVIDPLDHLHRVSSSFQHSNDFGAYLVVILMVLIGFIFFRPLRIKQRVLLFIITLPVAWCMFATGSRGAWLGFLIALLCFGLFKSRKFFILVLALFIISSFLMPASIKMRFYDIADAKVEGTVWERTKLWSGTIDMIKVHPVLGFGINTYTKNFAKYKPEDYFGVKYTHNSYLQMASEIGVAGASIFIIFLLTILYTSAMALRKFPTGDGRDIYIGLFAGIVGFLAHCTVDTQLYSVVLAIFLFFCLGLLVAFRNIADEKLS